MKISKMIDLLKAQLEKRGDVEVRLHGMYGAAETTFEVIEDNNVRKEERGALNIWTGINTG